MPERNGDGIEYREADDINETHANMFQVSPAGGLVALHFGEQKFELTRDGSSEASEVVYDTKVKMTVESAEALRELLNDVLVDEDDAGKTTPGVQ